MSLFRPKRLYLRILLWLLLNVAVLAAVFAGVLRWQFGSGLKGALGGLMDDRLQILGRELHERMAGAGRSEWPAILAALKKGHRVEMAIATLPDQVLAGELPAFPDKLRQQLLAMNPERPGGRPPPPPPRREDEESPQELLAALDEALDEMEMAQRNPAVAQLPSRPLPSRLGTFLIRDGSPALYYAGVRVPPPVIADLPRGPLVLIIASTSLTGDGLFFDTRPWLLAVFGAVALSALLWLPFVRQITRSIRAGMEATEQIAKGRFQVRMSETCTDELGRLAQAINHMATQLDGLVNGQKRFLGDVAHELCGPISRMEMSLAILEPRLDGGEAYRLAETRDELRQMSALVDELLAFAKSDLGFKKQPLQTLDLQPLLESTAELEGLPASLVHYDLPAGLSVQAVPELLRRAVGNVFRNARLHAPDSRLEVSARKQKNSVLLTLADSGPGVPAECLPRLFEPFYRVDVSRARETGGTGLGLAIVKSCLESCGGSVAARNRQPHGLIIEMEIPCA